MPAIGVVMVTRDRRENVLRSLSHLPDVPVCVVDNASGDGTVEAVRERFPHVDVVALDRNLGAGGRNVGVERLGTPYAAFADDDSWWAPGALDRAVEIFESTPRLGLIAARVLIGAEGRLDPTCEAMAASPLHTPPGLPGPRVLGFVACGAAVRSEAFLAVGGFDGRYGVGGEERRLALDMASAGWDLCYVDDVVAHHHPAPGGRPGRSWRALRNDLWTAWLRRAPQAAAAQTADLLRDRSPLVVLRAGAEAIRGLPWVLRERNRVPEPVERDAAALER